LLNYHRYFFPMRGTGVSFIELSMPQNNANYRAGIFCRVIRRRAVNRRIQQTVTLEFHRSQLSVMVMLFATLLAGCDVRKTSLNVPSATNDLQPHDALTTHANVESRTIVRTSTGLSMVLIRAGRFRMGRSEVGQSSDEQSPEAYFESPQFDQYRQCESPVHEVHITHDFRISQQEVTVGQFRAFVQATGYVTEAERSGTGCNGLDLATGSVVKRPEWVWTSPGFFQTDQHPVVCVSWNDAMEFCRWLSLETTSICHLPTEAEWEYCCRAGTATFFETGDTFASLRRAANCGDASLQSLCPWCDITASWDDGFAFTAAVGSFQANRLGLQDMHGNVGEWCLDWFQSDYYQYSSSVDPRGPATDQQWHVVRGGSWYNAPFSCRSSGRHDGISTEASTTNGFRVVMEIPLP